MQYLVQFTSANYAAPSEYVLVLAGSSKEAEIKVSDFVQDFFYEEDINQIEEDGIDCGCCFAVVTLVEEFDGSHGMWPLREGIQGYQF